MAPKPVLRIDKKTGQVLARYKSLRSTKEAEQGKRIAGHQCYTKALGTMRYFYRYEEDFDPCEDWKDKRNRPVWIIDNETGRIGWAVNMPEAAKMLGVTKQAVVHAIYKGFAVHSRYTLRLQRRLDEWMAFKKIVERNNREVSQG